ncbi:alpha/beta-hydrolase [Lophiostoma macrostomum CBS 122681]|uniref:Alpha/beta-hydrolase n=1 Tax=Lophiostoma macrostomum CBS 122681 TaxID=1314788 RepID=A0A6A6SM13_9PLEO|nr:alpha/beta-hydrolase [Lophiostoma macrostomum CBS 122681]
MADVGSDLTIQHFDLSDFTFQDGTHLPSVRLAYTDINPTASKVALLPTCFRGRISTTLTLCHGALKDHRIILVALFGNGESSSPSNTPNFPRQLDYHDCVRAQHALLTQKLHIASLDVILGFSMGGQTAYHWTVLYPTFVRSAVIICSSARTSLHNYQFLEGPRAALENSVDYPAPELDDQSGRASKGVQAFGKAYSAWLTSAEWFDQELYREMGCETLEQWDQAVTEVGYRGWHPDDLLGMLGMWQRGDVTKCDPNDEDGALKSIKARVLLLPCETDQYFRPSASWREVKHIRNGEVDVIPSVWGHIAGGGASKKDTEWMDRRIAKFLA